MSKRQSRNNRAQSMVELAAGIAVCLPVLLGVIDFGYIQLGSSINDNVCKDAALAAAGGKPAATQPTSSHAVTAGQPGYDRAVTVIRSHQPTRMPVKVSEQPEVTEVVRDIPPQEQGGAVDGEISVKTTVTILPPFIVGAYFGSKGVQLTSKHTTSFTYVVPQVVPPPDK